LSGTGFVDGFVWGYPGQTCGKVGDGNGGAVGLILDAGGGTDGQRGLLMGVEVDKPPIGMRCGMALCDNLLGGANDSFFDGFIDGFGRGRAGKNGFAQDGLGKGSSLADGFKAAAGGEKGREGLGKQFGISGGHG
jgi:hypothetical protein